MGREGTKCKNYDDAMGFVNDDTKEYEEFYGELKSERFCNIIL